MSNLLLVLMFLLYTVPPFLCGQSFLSLAFIIYGSIFGFEEFMSTFYTGSTVSQQVWQLIVSKNTRGYKLLGFMLCGAICWLIHFYFSGVLSPILLIMSFLFVSIPSIIYKQFFLTFAFIIFVLTVGFTDSISLQMTSMTIGDHLRYLVSQHIIKGIIVVLSLIGGWGCLLAHLGMRFKKG